MSGKVFAMILLICALLAGGALYWLQVYAFYDRLDPADVALRVTTSDGGLIDLPARDVRAIDSDSSPIRFRACFTTQLPQDVGFRVIDDPSPRVAPGWFDCFDADAIGADLESGKARAYLGEENVIYGIDRVLAIYPDGRGFAWHRINHCGQEVFDGNATPEGCPEPPARDQ